MVLGMISEVGGGVVFVMVSRLRRMVVVHCAVGHVDVVLSN